MQVNQVGFENSFRQHLDAEQRRAVLEAIGARINPDSTIGEVLDAAEALGWSEQMGDFSLADLAEALLAPESDSAPALTSADEDDLEQEDEDEDEDEDDLEQEDEDELEDEDDLEQEGEDPFELVVQESPSRRKKAAKKTTKKPAKKATKKTAKKPAKKSAKKTAKKTAKKATKKPAKKATKKKTGRRKPSVDDVDTGDRMSLDQAAEFFLPYVETLGEATMQALEEETGVSRRKLRFHVGQLVKNGYLERHGMGRGTYYTLA